MPHALDNPIWEALTTSQAHFAVTHGCARRFPKEITTLGAFPSPSAEAYEALAELVGAGETIGVFLPQPQEPPAGWTLTHAAPLAQMVHGGSVNLSVANPDELIPMAEADVPEMLELTKLTKPGPFGTRTRELGNYLGIRKNGALAAMAGERLRFPGHTEVSAVCTHPDQTGHGFAARLVTVLVNQIRDRGEVPFLHVRQENRRAIDLYKRLGFEERAVVHFAVVRKNA